MRKLTLVLLAAMIALLAWSIMPTSDKRVIPQKHDMRVAPGKRTEGACPPNCVPQFNWAVINKEMERAKHAPLSVSRTE